ncbi:hypothetical protein GGR57DRAFT_141808 [Xylariaceae sp. FL1272]|nr:hypothetical protein GGR57DRAFT_141808 [Xylariaceae sp. FL1272]
METPSLPVIVESPEDLGHQSFEALAFADSTTSLPARSWRDPNWRMRQDPMRFAWIGTLEIAVAVLVELVARVEAVPRVGRQIEDAVTGAIGAICLRFNASDEICHMRLLRLFARSYEKEACRSQHGTRDIWLFMALLATYDLCLPIGMTPTLVHNQA